MASPRAPTTAVAASTPAPPFSALAAASENARVDASSAVAKKSGGSVGPTSCERRARRAARNAQHAMHVRRAADEIDAQDVAGDCRGGEARQEFRRFERRPLA